MLSHLNRDKPFLPPTPSVSDEAISNFAELSTMHIFLWTKVNELFVQLSHSKLLASLMFILAKHFPGVFQIGVTQINILLITGVPSAAAIKTPKQTT